ncbi:unnamed protein product [Pleuronectes platessa]|uniref:Uncharacterized protein n=1 Tax=Pleuronectes platessa TaxID=8262 RepID=A0A9N7YDV7_PLEPL|nr:unnamed protein product [Pleuronectes platessa]
MESAESDGKQMRYGVSGAPGKIKKEPRCVVPSAPSNRLARKVYPQCGEVHGSWAQQTGTEVEDGGGPQTPLWSQPSSVHVHLPKACSEQEVSLQRSWLSYCLKFFNVTPPSLSASAETWDLDKTTGDENQVESMETVCASALRAVGIQANTMYVTEATNATQTWTQQERCQRIWKSRECAIQTWSVQALRWRLWRCRASVTVGASPKLKPTINTEQLAHSVRLTVTWSSHGDVLMLKYGTTVGRACQDTRHSSRGRLMSGMGPGRDIMRVLRCVMDLRSQRSMCEKSGTVC